MSYALRAATPNPAMLPLATLLPAAAGTDATGEQECADLGCCWSFPAPLQLEPWQPDVYLTACYYANGGNSSYAAVSANSTEVAEAGFDGGCSAWAVDVWAWFGMVWHVNGQAASLCVRRMRFGSCSRRCVARCASTCCCTAQHVTNSLVCPLCCGRRTCQCLAMAPVCCMPQPASVANELCHPLHHVQATRRWCSCSSQHCPSLGRTCSSWR